MLVEPNNRQKLPPSETFTSDIVKRLIEAMSTTPKSCATYERIVNDEIVTMLPAGNVRTLMDGLNKIHVDYDNIKLHPALM